MHVTLRSKLPGPLASRSADDSTPYPSSGHAQASEGQLLRKQTPYRFTDAGQILLHGSPYPSTLHPCSRMSRR